jgi:hypothetical protein
LKEDDDDDDIALNGRMVVNDYLRRKRFCPTLKYYTSIYMEELKKTTEFPCHD